MQEEDIFMKTFIYLLKKYLLKGYYVKYYYYSVLKEFLRHLPVLWEIKHTHIF